MHADQLLVKRGILFIFMLAVLLFWGGLPCLCSAVTIPSLSIDPGSLRVKDPGKACIRGELSICGGQKIILYDARGKRLTAVTMPDDGSRNSFRIPVPKKSLKTGHMSVTKYSLKSLAAEGVAASKAAPAAVTFTGYPTYTVVFHGSGAERGKMDHQKISRGKTARLFRNAFTRKGYRFVGWSTRKCGVVSMKAYQIGRVRYPDRAQVKNLARADHKIHLYACWQGSGAQAACDWAKRIASDDSFCYGSKPVTSRHGCYYCGTNGDKVRLSGGDSRFYKTYVCMTFVNAAYVHGANESRMKCTYASGRCLDGLSRMEENKKHLGEVFADIGKPRLSGLRPGDVLLAWRNGKNHTAMYLGNGYYVQATHRYGSWVRSSISVSRLSESAYGWFDGVLRYRSR